MSRRTKIIVASISATVLVLTSILIVYFTVFAPGGLTEFDNIVIWNDGDFRNYDFKGKGTVEDPYIIANYEITTSIARGIYITDTSKYFVIDNCVIEAPYTGIYIQNTAANTVTITNTICKNSEIGIFVTKSEGIQLINNTLNNIAGEHGISIYHSSGAIISSNNIDSVAGWNSLEMNLGNGLAITNCPESYVSSNEIAFSEGNGIYISTSPNSVIEQNNLVENEQSGLFIWNSEGCSINDNEFLGTAVILENFNRHLYDSFETVPKFTLDYYLSFLFENNYVDGKPMGFFSSQGDFSISTDTFGQYIFVNCFNLTISNLELSESIGLLFYHCRDIIIADNNISYAPNNGISINFCDNFLVTNNICNFNRVNGMFIFKSNNSLYSNNSFISNNHYGLSSLSSFNNSVFANQCNFNKNSGIGGSMNLEYKLIGNNCTYNNIAGIEFGRSTYITISNNTLNGGVYGLFMSGAFNYSIFFNEISLNSMGIHLSGKASFGFSENCTIYKNLISNNTNYGVVNSQGSFNKIYNNSFIFNNMGELSQAFDLGSENYWYDNIAFAGNYWSNWSGIGTYVIEGPSSAEDLYPLMSPPI